MLTAAMLPGPFVSPRGHAGGTSDDPRLPEGLAVAMSQTQQEVLIPTQLG